MSDPDILHALNIPYATVHFLVNRTQCEASVFAADVGERGSGFGWFHETLTVDGELLCFFDLHGYLTSRFRVKSSEKAQLGLILSLGRLEAETQEVLHAVFGEDFDRKRIALRVSSETAMRSIHLGELEPLGITMRSYLNARGVLAVHPEEDSMGFLIDLDRILYLSAREVA